MVRISKLHGQVAGYDTRQLVRQRRRSRAAESCRGLKQPCSTCLRVACHGSATLLWWVGVFRRGSQKCAPARSGFRGARVADWPVRLARQDVGYVAAAERLFTGERVRVSEVPGLAEDPRGDAPDVAGVNEYGAGSARWHVNLVLLANAFRVGGRQVLHETSGAQKRVRGIVLAQIWFHRVVRSPAIAVHARQGEKNYLPNTRTVGRVDERKKGHERRSRSAGDASGTVDPRRPRLRPTRPAWSQNRTGVGRLRRAVRRHPSRTAQQRAPGRFV